MKLLDFEFFQCLNESLKSVQVEDLAEICHGNPIPANAVVVCVMPHHLQCFLALLTMANKALSREQADFEDATNSGDASDCLSFPELRLVRENVEMMEVLFWGMLRAKVPPPPAFDAVKNPVCNYGPNLEVYYELEGQVAPVLPPSLHSFEVEPPPRVQ